MNVCALWLAVLLGLLPTSVQSATPSILARGEYLAKIGVCAACHTPPRVPEVPPDPRDLTGVLAEQQLRSNPEWTRYLDHDREMAGGVPFIIRLSATAHGVVFSRNITPDKETGIGNWSEAEIVRAIRTGLRPDGSSLFLFAPHSFFPRMAEEDAAALARYLKSLRPVRHEVAPRQLPFVPGPAKAVGPTVAPTGDTPKRAIYLLRAVVGCTECHSYHDSSGVEHPFAGGDPADEATGVFRLGPDLPLRQVERGFAAFPYPGYAVLYAPNLTEFGKGGSEEGVSLQRVKEAIQFGIDPDNDDVGKPVRLSSVMMWHFYVHMHKDDVDAIARYLRTLRPERHDIGPTTIYFGTNWESAFRKVFGVSPSDEDRTAFGKK